MFSIYLISTAITIYIKLLDISILLPDQWLLKVSFWLYINITQEKQNLDKKNLKECFNSSTGGNLHALKGLITYLKSCCITLGWEHFWQHLMHLQTICCGFLKFMLQLHYSFLKLFFITSVITLQNIKEITYKLATS